MSVSNDGKPVDEVSFWEKRIRQDSLSAAVHSMAQGDWERHERTHRRIAREHIPKGSRVLDAGCAYGRASRWFSPEDYVGVDFVPRWIEIAQERNPDYEFICADLKDLPFEDGEFDWAVVSDVREMVLENLGPEEWQVMEGELRRVCGRMLVMEHYGEFFPGKEL